MFRQTLLGGEVRLEHPLDLRGARATLDPPDDPLALDERERGHGLHLEPLREFRLLVDVDRGHAETGALLAREVRHQALHAPCRTGSGGAEEDEDWPRIITHGNDIFPANTPSKPGRRPALYTPGGMWETYRIGLALGLGIAIGGLVSALLAPRRALPLSAAGLASAAAGAAVGYAIGGWHEAVGGGAGGVLGALVVAVLVGGTLSRGGTRAGTAALVGLGALVLAALALVPFVGYLEAVALPALAGRARRRQPERYAGLRSLARD